MIVTPATGRSLEHFLTQRDVIPQPHIYGVCVWCVSGMGVGLVVEVASGSFSL